MIEMHRSWLRIIGLTAMALLPLLLSASCSSSGGSDDSTTPAVDTTAPLVISVSPHDGEVGVALAHTILVAFSEAMDPATTTGNVTLTPGANVTLTWVADDTLEIGHDNWAEGIEVALILGVGLADTSGNVLPAVHTSSFWTWTSQVQLLSTDPDSGAVGVATNAGVILHFSHAMNTTTLHDAITVSPAIDNRFTQEITEYEFRVGSSSGWATGTEYTLTVGTGAMTRYPPYQYLAAPVTITFTTGTEADTTPPYIVSTLPARGASGVATATNQAIITFSEPVDPNQFDPTRLGAHVFIWIAGEPQWSADRRTVTLFFRTPLPTGVRFFAVFNPGDFQDDAGNPSVTADSLSFTVASAIDFTPVVSGAWYGFARQWTDSDVGGHWAGRDTVWVRHENVQLDGRFDRVRANGPGFALIDDRKHFQLTNTALEMRGFYDYNQAVEVWFTPSVDYVALPFQVRNWSGSSTSGDMTITYDGHILGQEVLHYESTEMDRSLVLEKCWKMVLNYSFSGGIPAGADTLWWAPGLGVVQTFSSGTEIRDSVTSTYWSRDRLISLDPFGD
jgi:hypothetical protein